jgi:hypothetical protein
VYGRSDCWQKAEHVADLLAGRSPAVDPRPYRANRF